MDDENMRCDEMRSRRKKKKKKRRREEDELIMRISDFA